MAEHEEETLMAWLKRLASTILSKLRARPGVEERLVRLAVTQAEQQLVIFEEAATLREFLEAAQGNLNVGPITDEVMAALRANLAGALALLPPPVEDDDGEA